ncbi:peptidase S8/S53 domain-containing protein [Polychytrium aggregatum]|uniref:peptidase S8/S53 domain-containing protein n=1 Tax=Polychytrium aggregatum TaxID=110093 RepID=UPI0022FE36EA|nr:peptidase S8/S53 domain-containing protein [Polychytrium aggregatum]KAI9206460.1 peptidase S8/S53 domain-containing protein [Polychytrium aggregatum]
MTTLRAYLWAACVALALLLQVSASAVKTEVVPSAPLLSADGSTVIKDSYIVVFREELSQDAFLRNVQTFTAYLQTTLSTKEALANRGIKNVFNIAPEVRGFVGIFTEADVHELQRNADVAYVEKDSVVYVTEDQVDAPWGLARISHATHPEGEDANTYSYYPDAGEGVTAYVIDTGVNIHHVDFEGRAVWGATIPEGDEDADGNGHGTHVSGTIAGKTFGVAKKAKIVAVKVLRSNGSGSMSDVLGGIDWAVEAHRREDEALRKKGKKAKSVANMSLGGGKSPALDAAVNAAVAAGIHFAVAAGNENRDACNSSPAAAAKAVTVAASNSDDARAWFSNWGSCVDIIAPGQDILSAWIGSNVATNVISGTSMASPHVCGAIAALLSRPEYEDLSPAVLKARLIRLSKKNLISNVPRGSRTPNRFLYVPPPSELDAVEQA